MPDSRPLILNVDDTEAGRYAKSRALRLIPEWDVIEAATGEAALQLVEARRPTLVLLDVKLPDINGLEVCRRIKASWPGIFVLQISASYVSGEDRTRGLDAGADGYLTQPIAPTELVASVRALLRIRDAEARLRVSEERLRLVVDGAVDYVILTLDDEGKITGWSSGAQAVLGWTEAEVLGRPGDLIFTPEDRAAGAPERELEGARRDGYAEDERWHLRKDGERAYLSGSMRPLHDAQDRPRGFLKVARDQTGQRRAAEALARTEADFKTLADNIPTLCWMADATGWIYWYNRRWHEYTGKTSEQMEGWGWRSVHDPDRLTDVEERWRESLATGEPFEMVFPLRRADGVFRPFLTRIAPVRSEDGQLQRWFGTNTDISEQRAAEEALRALNETLEQRVDAEVSRRTAAEEQLRQAQKMEAVGQLTGGIAHDFNNLLQIVTGNLEILRRNLPEDAGRLRRSADNAMTGAKRAATLTQRLLAFSRRQPLAPKAINVNQLVAGMSDLLTRALGETIALETVLGAGLWRIEADPHQLENALLNLAVNARDAMPNGGKLTIETANAHLDQAYLHNNVEVSPGQYVVLCVSDMGEGMDRDTAARAFEPFFTTKEVGKGTGLGLSMVYGFVKQSGGNVTLYSEPGQGTTVKIYLPRLAGAVEDDAVTIAQPVPEGSKSEVVLVVEDDDDVRAYTVEALRELGYRVLEAHDGASAIRLVQRHIKDGIDLLFTDVVLPGGMNGEQVAAQALALSPGLKVLFTTGYARNAIVHHGRLDPGVRLLTKPFTYDDLAARVRDLLDT